MRRNKAFVNGKLSVRFTPPEEGRPVNKGLQKIETAGRRDALLYIPAGYTPGMPSPLAMMLHGAGGTAEHGMSLLQHFADDRNMILFAPASQTVSWDIIEDQRFRADILFIDDTLEDIFHHYAVDRKHIMIGGFSDGASYALSVGLINGGLFTHIVAFSPGFFYSPEMHGSPNIFISHGIHDDILPIDVCSRRIVPVLRQQGYGIEYHEFDGQHVLPQHIQEDALRWMFKE